MATISIIMPVYNSKEYLKEAINSILDQTYTDWELLIINEYGSNDGSKEIIEEYSKVDTRIILIQNEERLGISASMNVGIDRASGKYIARMDADDISMPHRFQRQVEFMGDNPDIGMCGVEVEIFGSNSFEWELETDRNKLATNILFYSPSVHPTVMIRKEILDKYNLRYNVNYKASEDYELFSKICAVTSVANINEVLFRYRIMENNATFKNNDIGIVLYSEVMNNQFKKMGLKFTEEEIQLLSPHYSMKQSEGREVLERLVKLDLLLKKILVANEKCNLYNRKYLSNTLHKRFKEAYDSVNWECKNYDRKKLDEIYDKSIFKNEFFYENKEKINNITPLITVLMPTFNSEKYVADTIWSVLNQTFGDFEFLIVNEFGSNDDTIQIIKMFDDLRIRVIQNTERLGLAESLNLGIREARGKYIARIDADDLCDKERFKLQVEFLDNNEEYGVCGSWQHHFGIDTDYIHKVPVAHEDLKAQFVYNCELCHSTLMLRRDYFINNNLFFNKNAAAEDYELWTRAIYKFKFANIPRVLGEYRIGEDNITAKKMERLSQESAELAVKNIKEHLNVDVPKEHEKYMTGWVNEFDNISDKNKYKEVLNTEKRILKEMWNSNNKMNSYNPESLLKVIARRWFWCNNTNNRKYNSIICINDVFDKKLNNKSIEYIPKQSIIRCNIKKAIKALIRPMKPGIKKIMKVFYKPIRKRTVDVLQQQLWDIDGHTYDYIENLKAILDENRIKLTQLEEKIDKIEKNNLEIIGAYIWKSEKNILETMDSRIWKSELLMERKIYDAVKYSQRFQNWIIDQNQMNLKENQNGICDYLLLNDTFNTFHHGSTGTSLAILHHLKQKTSKEIISIPLQDASMPIGIYPKNINDFTSIEFYKRWSELNKDIIGKIKLCKHVIVNGEGCISHYNDGTLNMLYIIYISKTVFNKKVSLINHSVFTSNYVDVLNVDEQKDFINIVLLVYNILDNCKVREKYSLKELNDIGYVKSSLAFDCLPLYIEEIYKNNKESNNLAKEYITISGGNFLDEWYTGFIYEILPELKKKYPNAKIIFLYSDIPYSETTGDMEIFKLLKNKLGENSIILKKVNLTDEWLGVLEKSYILISGRFHHTIASFMLDIPFLAFKTNTKKLEGILEIMEKEESLLERENIDKSIEKARRLISSNKFYLSNNNNIKNKIITLAKSNFKNI